MLRSWMTMGLFLALTFLGNLDFAHGQAPFNPGGGDAQPGTPGTTIVPNNPTFQPGIDMGSTIAPPPLTPITPGTPGTPGPSDTTPAMDANLLKGVELLNDKKYDEAVAHFKEMIKADPKLAGAHYLLGATYRMQNKLDDALREFDAGIELQDAPGSGSNPGETYFRRGIVWFYKGEPEIARADFVDSLTYNDHDPRVYTWIGFCYMERKELSKALENYSLAIKYDATYAPAFNNRGLANLKLKSYDSAVADFTQLIRLNFRDGEAYFKRGVAYDLANKPEDALKNYTQAIRLAPEFQPAYTNRALIYDRLNNAKSAAADREALEKLRNKEEVPPPKDEKKDEK